MDYDAALIRHAAASEPGRYALNGVCVECAKGSDRAVIVASDGHLLVGRHMGIDEPPTSAVSAIIPADAIHAGRPTRRSTTLVEVSKDDVTIKTKAGRSTIDLVDGLFPDYRNVFPAPGRYWTLKFSRAVLEKLLKATTADEFTFGLRPDSGEQDKAIPVHLHGFKCEDGFAVVMPYETDHKKSGGWADVDPWERSWIDAKKTPKFVDKGDS